MSHVRRRSPGCRRIAPVAFAILFALSGCYDVATDIIGAGEGVRVDQVSDGVYTSYSGDETSVVRVGWDGVANEYSVEERGESKSFFSRIRVIPLVDRYYLVQQSSEDGRFVMIAAVEGTTVTFYDAEFGAARNIAAQRGVQLVDDEFWPYIENTDAAAIRAFMADLAVSGLLQPFATYQYTGPP